MSKASSVERLMLDLINEERSAAGLAPLRLELRLNAAAERHSAWMIETDTFSHTGAGGSRAGDRMSEAGFAFSGAWAWGENVALQTERGAPGLADDVADLHRALMESPGHRANILDERFEVVGIGVERGPYEGLDAVVVTQNFARTSAPLQIDGGGAAPSRAPNAAPSAEIDDFVLAAGRWEGIADRVRFEDGDGDPALSYEIQLLKGGARMRLDGKVVDVQAGHRFAADDLDAVTLRAGSPGTTSALQIRAFDGEDWGAWDRFDLKTKAPNLKPVVTVADIEVEAGRFKRVAGRTKIDDDGEVSWIELLDDTGASNFRLRGEGRIDASEGHWLPVERLADLRVRGDAAPSEQTLKIRAWDGEDLSDWATFTLTTLAGDALA